MCNPGANVVNQQTLMQPLSGMDIVSHVGIGAGEGQQGNEEMGMAISGEVMAAWTEGGPEGRQHWPESILGYRL